MHFPETREGAEKEVMETGPRWWEVGEGAAHGWHDGTLERRMENRPGAHPAPPLDTCSAVVTRPPKW